PPTLWMWFVMPRVIDFEIPADDIERITTFYQTVFGWKVEKWKGPVDHWFLITGDDAEPGINGSFAQREEFPEGVTVNVIGVEDIDKYIKLIKTNNGTIIGEKMTIPGVGYYVYFKDTEGNLMGMMQYDSTVK
ncbi:MAG: VOC family protein, partial [Promethearchaeota archaeon]